MNASFWFLVKNIQSSSVVTFSDDFIHCIVGVVHFFRPAWNTTLTCPRFTGAGAARCCRSRRRDVGAGDGNSGRGVGGRCSGVGGGDGDSVVRRSGIQFTGLAHVQRGQPRHGSLGHVRGSLGLFARVTMRVVRGQGLARATVGAVGVARAQRPPWYKDPPTGSQSVGAGQGGALRQVVNREGLYLGV